MTDTTLEQAAFNEALARGYKCEQCEHSTKDECSKGYVSYPRICHDFDLRGND